MSVRFNFNEDIKSETGTGRVDAPRTPRPPNVPVIVPDATPRVPQAPTNRFDEVFQQPPTWTPPRPRSPVDAGQRKAEPQQTAERIQSPRAAGFPSWAFPGEPPAATTLEPTVNSENVTRVMNPSLEGVQNVDTVTGEILSAPADYGSLTDEQFRAMLTGQKYSELEPDLKAEVDRRGWQAPTTPRTEAAPEEVEVSETAPSAVKPMEANTIEAVRRATLENGGKKPTQKQVNTKIAEITKELQAKREAAVVEAVEQVAAMADLEEAFRGVFTIADLMKRDQSIAPAVNSAALANIGTPTNPSMALLLGLARYVQSQRARKPDLSSIVTMLGWLREQQGDKFAHRIAEGVKKRLESKHRKLFAQELGKLPPVKSTEQAPVQEQAPAVTQETLAESARPHADLTFEQLVEEHAKERVHDLMSEMVDESFNAQTSSIAKELNRRMADMTLDEVKSYGRIIDERIPPDDEFSTGAVALEEMWQKAQLGARLDKVAEPPQTEILEDTQPSQPSEEIADVFDEEIQTIGRYTIDENGNLVSAIPAEEGAFEAAPEAQPLLDETIDPVDAFRQLYEKFQAEEMAAEAAAENEGPPPPTDEPPSGEGGPTEPEKPSKPVRPKSRTRQAIEASIARIRENLTHAMFSLSGDKVTLIEGPEGGVRVEHSPEVEEELNVTAAFFGRKREQGDTTIEKQLFKAFQIYRGLSVDRKDRLFGKKKWEDLKITDEAFIAFLKEIRNNVRMYNNPFAYSNPNYRLGGVVRFPTVISKGLAVWFTSGDAETNKLNLTAEKLIEESIRQWVEVEYPRIKKFVSFDQREVLLDMVEAVLPELGDVERYGLTPRDLDARLTWDEIIDPDSDFAKLFNSESDLTEIQRMRVERLRKILARQDKKRRRGALDKRGQILSPDDVLDDPTSFFENLMEATPHDAARLLSAVARINSVMLLLPLAPTGIAEKVEGMLIQGAGIRALRGIMNLQGPTDVKSFYQAAVKGEGAPTQEMYDDITEKETVRAVGEMIKILAAKGRPGLTDAAARGVDFTREDLGKTVQEGDSRLIKTRKGAESLVEFGMNITTGDWVAKPATARIFLEALVYQFERSAMLNEKGAKKTGDRTAGTYTREQLGAALRTDPNKFLRDMAMTPEGMQAIVYASNTSLAGVDPLSEYLRKMTANSLSDMAFGFAVGWFLKFGERALMRIVPFSNSMLYIMLKGPASIGQEFGVVSETANSEMNEFMLGGNEGFWRGLAQNTVVDLARFGSQATSYAFCYLLISAFGGLGAPDDEDKEHLWYEWKIGGKAIKENWYWNELLGFAMPIAVALHAGATGKKDAMDILVHGSILKLEENPWLNAIDMIDFVNLFDQKFAEAQDRSAGYMGGRPSDDEYALTQIAVWLMRRGYQSFEPAAVRMLYNERGLFKGRSDLAHSTSMVYTGDERNPTDPTTWVDAQFRRAAYPSPGLGFLMNAVNGFFFDNPDMRETGYWRHQMPLVTNSDPVNQFWIDELSVYDENDKFVSIDRWTPQQRQERINTIISLLKSRSASELAANGVVIPYDARDITAEYLYLQKVAIRNEYEVRVGNGEWYPAYEPENKRAKNEAWNKVVADQGEVQVLIDKLFDDVIPYSAVKYNRWETNYRPVYKWKEGTRRAGEPATSLDWRLHHTKVEMELYASGDHKSSLLPWLTVDDRGEDTYDSQTPLSWQNDLTDLEFIRQMTEGKKIRTGMNTGRDAWSVISGEGAIGPGAPQEGDWDRTKLVFGARAMIAAQTIDKKLDKEKYRKIVDAATNKAATPTTGGGGSGGWSSGGGGGDYAPKIYSHSPGNLNADKPAGFYSKVPSSTRFDYLRPSVATKGSREAYRREDF